MSKLSVELIALADYVSLSKENKITIAGIFDRFFIEDVPTNWPTMSVVAVFRGVPESEHKLLFKIVDSTGKIIIEKELPLKVGSNGKANFITSLQNFPLRSFGEHKILLTEGESKAGEVDFIVNKSKKPNNEMVS